MSTFFVAILGGLAWMGLTANLGPGAFAFGATVAFVTWRVLGARAHRPFGPLRALRLVWIGVRLFFVFLWDLLLANIEQLRIVLSPEIDVRPGWIRFRSELETPAMRALLGAMLSLTPGSVTYEEQSSDEGWVLCVHVLDLRDEAALIAHIRQSFETPLHAMEQL